MNINDYYPDMIDLTPYKELRSGERSIHDAIDKTQVIPEKVIAYLRCGEPLLMAPGMYEHPFKAGVTLLGPYIYTDGKYFWDRDTWKYVVKYNVALPQAFIDRVMSEEGTRFIEQRIDSHEDWSDTIKTWKKKKGFSCFLPDHAGEIALIDF